LEGASRIDAFSAYPVPTWLPGDAASATAGTPEQTSLAIPLIILYEASILSCRMVEKARTKREAEEEAELAGKGKPAGGT